MRQGQWQDYHQKQSMPAIAFTLSFNTALHMYVHAGGNWSSGDVERNGDNQQLHDGGYLLWVTSGEDGRASVQICGLGENGLSFM